MKLKIKFSFETDFDVFQEVGLGGGETDSAHTATSVTSVVSVMSEVRGDWGAVRRVKETNRVS